jgi:hypothetical protein
MSPSSVLFALCLASLGFALTILVTDPRWTKELSWFLPVLWTLAAVFGILAIPVVRRWLAGIGASGHPSSGLTQEGIGNVSQDVEGSGNRAIGGDYHERHEHHYHARPQIHRQTLAVKINGKNQEFLLEHIPIAGSVDFYLNGVYYKEGFYRVNERKLIVAGLLKTTDEVTIKYMH